MEVCKMDEDIRKKIKDSIVKDMEMYIEEVIENGEIDVYKKMDSKEIVKDFVLWIKEGGSS